MDLRQFDCFLAVAETLHFGRAADALHMSQSSVSEAIRRWSGRWAARCSNAAAAGWP